MTDLPLVEIRNAGVIILLVHLTPACPHRPRHRHHKKAAPRARGAASYFLLWVRASGLLTLQHLFHLMLSSVLKRTKSRLLIRLTSALIVALGLQRLRL